MRILAFRCHQLLQLSLRPRFHVRRHTFSPTLLARSELIPVRGLHTTYTWANGTPKDVPPKETPPDTFIKALEDMAGASWLHTKPRSEKETLQRIHSVLFQVFLYIGRPQEGNSSGPEQYLLDFEQAEVPVDSEMHRARVAAVTLIGAAQTHINGIPLNAKVREEQTELFALFGAIVPLCEMSLPSKDQLNLDEWKAFWGRATPILLETAVKLDEKGFGFEE